MKVIIFRRGNSADVQAAIDSSVSARVCAAQKPGRSGNDPLSPQENIRASADDHLMPNPLAGHLPAKGNISHKTEEPPLRGRRASVHVRVTHRTDAETGLPDWTAVLPAVAGLRPRRGRAVRRGGPEEYRGGPAGLGGALLQRPEARPFAPQAVSAAALCRIRHSGCRRPLPWSSPATAA